MLSIVRKKNTEAEVITEVFLQARGLMPQVKSMCADAWSRERYDFMFKLESCPNVMNRREAFGIDEAVLGIH
jgi:hypothetical protein